MEEPPRAAASGPVATRAPSVRTKPTSVTTGASAGSITALGVEKASYDMRMTGAGRGGCRPKTNCVIKGKPGSAIMHKKPTKEIASQKKYEGFQECDSRERRLASLKAELGLPERIRSDCRTRIPVWLLRSVV